MMRTDRVGLVHVALLLFAIALIGRAAQVQLWQGRMWAAKAQRQQFGAAPSTAPRGPILDATEAVLVESRDAVQLSVAPREVKDRPALSRALVHAGVPATWVARATDPREKWVVIPGDYPAADAGPLTTIAGVHAQMTVDREPVGSEGMRRLLGRVGINGGKTDGMELALDSVLRGDAGRQTYLRDARGSEFESPAAAGTPSRAGNTVVLTLNHALQEICERALGDAVARLSASGGDIVVADPQDGSILAMASARRDPKSTALTALTEPFEPGSTVKPFIAAALLTLGRATPGDVIDTHDGVFVLNGRTLHDEHKFPRLTLRDVIKYSSNIGIAQFAERLSAGEEYQALRDVGFGAPTGLPYPAEAYGTLPLPTDWSVQSPASLAIGYEMNVTPVQLVMAYASIANGGWLLEPALVREIRQPDGTVIYKHTRRVVRRDMPQAVADTVRSMLVGAVEAGTAVQADLSTFDVAGKTGTARRTAGKHYAAHAYTATFVGLFPARDPQYVILVTLDNPTGDYFGGKTAAPVSKTVLEAAIAARDAALDRTVLTSRDHLVHVTTPTPIVESGETVMPAAPTVVTLRVPLAPMARETTVNAPGHLIPDVSRLSLRLAVRTLEDSGFHVALIAGQPGRTWPAAGTVATPGTTVRLAGTP
jgi:cell division protein FtsI (penicillin-binding protein 3)